MYFGVLFDTPLSVMIVHRRMIAVKGIQDKKYYGLQFTQTLFWSIMYMEHFIPHLLYWIGVFRVYSGTFGGCHG